MSKKCPICGTELKRVCCKPEYWMCFKCIKGYNNQELKWLIDLKIEIYRLLIKKLEEEIAETK